MEEAEQARHTNTEAQHEFRVRLLGQRGIDPDLLEAVASCFLHCPGPIGVTVHGVPVDLEPDEAGILPWEVAYEVMEEPSETKRSQPDEFVVLMNCCPNEHGWRIFPEPVQPRTLFCYVEDFNEHSRLSPGVVGAHFILQGIIDALLCEADEFHGDHWHGEPRGCLFDFTETRHEILTKLKVAGICSDCLGLLLRKGIPRALVQQAADLMGFIRQMAIKALAGSPRTVTEADTRVNGSTPQ